MLKIQEKFSTFIMWFVKESLSFIYVSIQEREKSVPMYAYKFQSSTDKYFFFCDLNLKREEFSGDCSFRGNIVKM